MSVTLTPFAGLDNVNVENPEALYLVAGSGTDLDGKLVRAVALVDPATGAAMTPFSGVTTIADGADVAQGATTDTTSALTVVGRLKNLLSRWPAALTGSGNLRVAQQEALPVGTNSIGGVTIADGAAATLGTTTDASSTSTAIGLLKNLKAALAGTVATSVADGANVTIGTTTDAASAVTLVGLLKNLKAALAGTLTIAAASTTLVVPSTSTTTANADNTVTFSHQVTRYVLVNGSGATVYVNEGSAASPGSTPVAAGGYVDSDLVPVTALHVYTTAVTSVNGSTAGGLVVRGTY